MQKTIIAIGLLVLLLGIGWPWLGKLPFWRLPGDIVIHRENFRFYFPLMTMIFLSIFLSLIFWLLKK
ncbi:MAG: DUF2905 domain-containing protein [Proteobacteria bacterium]|nr:DUF2905 domain-containing protein [Pseudomonadota bacterium]MDA0993142.1 DUF2905 domain-containing protein [Pseudomonadota bacterium]